MIHASLNCTVDILTSQPAHTRHSHICPSRIGWRLRTQTCSRSQRWRGWLSFKPRKNFQEELQPLWRQCNGPRCQSPTEVDKDIFTYLLELDLSRVSVSQDAGDKARPAAQRRCQGEPCSLAPTHPLQLLPQSYRETIIIHWAGGAHLPLPPSYLHHSAWWMGFHYLVPRPPVAYKSHTSWDTSLNLHAVALSGAWQKISAMAWPTLHPVKTISRRCKLNYSAHDKINMKYW